jgi:hypothetical protein
MLHKRIVQVKAFLSQENATVKVCEFLMVCGLLTLLVLVVSSFCGGCAGGFHIPDIKPSNETPGLPNLPKGTGIPIAQLVTVGLLAVAASVALMGLAPGFQKFGLAGILGGGALIAGALAVQKYQGILGLTAALGFVIIVGVATLKHVKFGKEIVGTVKKIREHLTPDQDVVLFGNKEAQVPGTIREVQSEETSAMVKKIRKVV